MLDDGRAENFEAERAEALRPTAPGPNGVRLVGRERRPPVARTAPAPASAASFPR
jgi:hypothetical protein